MYLWPAIKFRPGKMHMNGLEKIFHLKENGTNARTELLGMNIRDIDADESSAEVEARTRALLEQNRRLESMALTDELTGLSNRRHALLTFAREWEASMQQDTPLSCLVIDADGFKQVNDKHGHDAGDLVLKQVRYSFLNYLVAYRISYFESTKTWDFWFQPEYLSDCHTIHTRHVASFLSFH